MEIVTSGVAEILGFILVTSWLLLSIASKKYETTPWHMPVFATLIRVIGIAVHEASHAIVVIAANYHILGFGMKDGYAYIQTSIPESGPSAAMAVAITLAGPIGTVMFGYAAASIFYTCKYLNYRYLQRISGYIMFSSIISAFLNLIPIDPSVDGAKAIAHTARALEENFALTVCAWGAVLFFTLGLVIANLNAINFRAFRKWLGE